MQGPTANRFAHVIVGEVRVLCCPLGFTLLSVGASPPLLWRVGRGLLSFPCLDRVRVVVAPRGRMFPLGVFGYLPFIYGLAAAGVAACGSGTRDPLVWGWCGFRAWWCWGVGDDGMPRDCACWVRLRGFLVFWWGVLLRASRCARSAVCLSAVSCSVACCWFVAICFVWRLLHVVRFVSAPAPTVTWFMQVCAGVHLTATVVVVYCLPCNGRFWQFAARFCAPGCSR